MAERTDRVKRSVSPERLALLAQERLRDVERRRFLDQVQPQADDAILDVGCSTGRLMQQLRTGYGVQTVWGVDPDPVVRGNDEHIVTASATDLSSFENGQFTKLLYSHSLEHVTDKAAALAEAYRVLRDNGELHIVYFLYDEQTFVDPSVRAAAPELPDYLTQAEITRLIQDAGFDIEHAEVLDQISSLQDKAGVPSLLILARKLSTAKL